MQHELDELIDEVRVLYQALVAIAGQLHGAGMTVGMRAVLEALAKGGPSTVPALARARRVTRQRIQSLVDACRAAGYVETHSNPAHARSMLIALTASGRSRIERLRAREFGVVAKHAEPLAPARLRAASRTLRAVRASLEGAAAAAEQARR